MQVDDIGYGFVVNSCTCSSDGIGSNPPIGIESKKKRSYGCSSCSSPAVLN